MVNRERKHEHICSKHLFEFLFVRLSLYLYNCLAFPDNSRLHLLFSGFFLLVFFFFFLCFLKAGWLLLLLLALADHILCGFMHTVKVSLNIAADSIIINNCFSSLFVFFFFFFFFDLFSFKVIISVKMLKYVCCLVKCGVSV